LFKGLHQVRILWAVLTAVVAVGKGRRPLPWAILGFMGGWVALGVACLSRQRPLRPVPPWMLNLGYQSQAKRAFAKIDTPKDLLG
jgi:hypothetical protein